MLMTCARPLLHHVWSICSGLGGRSSNQSRTGLTRAKRPSEVRQQLEQSQMPVDSAPGNDHVRQSYNFAPGYHGLVYRADGPEPGTSSSGHQQDDDEQQGKQDNTSPIPAAEPVDNSKKYKLQAMKWGECGA